MTKGSLWRKWDLHLHTPHSILNNHFGDPLVASTWDSYADAVEKTAKNNEISAIGFTDYFIIDGYAKMKEYKENRGKLKDIFIFPNIEFRADKVITAHDERDKRLNFHVIFSPDISLTEIQENFLQRIKFMHQEEPFSPAYHHSLTRYNLEDFGKTLKAQHPPFAAYSDLEVGYMNAVVDPHDVKEILEDNPKFKGNYLICLSEDYISLLDWNTQAHGTRKHLLQMSQCMFSANPGTHDFCLGQNGGSTPELFIKEFRSLKPCIWGCDSHGYNDRFLVPDNERFCWIKADLTWEGLKQILYEPSDRVRIQKDSPESQKSIHTLNRIDIEETAVNQTLSIRSTTIDFNSNLISIIGGKGSGKTALLDMIASCFEEGKRLSEVQSSFLYRLYNKNSSEPINIKLGTKLKSEAINKKFGADSTIIKDTNIRYITQNHFEGISSPSMNLGKYVFDLLFEKYPDALSHYRQIESAINEKQSKISTINLEARQLSEQVAQRPFLEEQKERKKGDKLDYEIRIKEIEQKELVNSKIDQLTTKLKDKREERKLIESAQKRLQNIESVTETLKALSDSITGFNDDFVEKLDLKSFDVFEEEKLQIIEKIILENMTSLQKKEVTVNKEIEQINKELRQFEDTSKIITELKEKLISTTEDIEKLEKQIEECNKKVEKLQATLQEAFDCFIETINANINVANALSGHISTFENGRNAQLRNLKFSVQSEVNNEEYCNLINEMINNRKISQIELDKKLKELIITPINWMLKAGEVDKTDELKLGYDEIEDLLSDKLIRGQSTHDLRNKLFAVPIKTSINLSFDGIPLDRLSMGQRAIVLLQIILAYDDKPLLIDQPEENLDNAYIYEQLVSAFRDAKNKRQIIIATHNANLVVNTDSEQIIVAQFKDGKISYSAGTIENLDTREQIKRILEGGKEAFEKREEKYGYKF